MQLNLYYILNKKERVIREQQAIIEELTKTIEELSRGDSDKNPCFDCDERICTITCPHYDVTELE